MATVLEEHSWVDQISGVTAESLVLVTVSTGAPFLILAANVLLVSSTSDSSSNVWLSHLKS